MPRIKSVFSPTKATILVQAIIIFLGSLQWPRSSPYASFLCITVGAVVPCVGFSFRMIWPSPISAGNVACWLVTAESLPWIFPQPKIAAFSKYMPPYWVWLASPVWTSPAGTPQSHNIMGSAEIFAEALWHLKCFLCPILLSSHLTGVLVSVPQ